MAAVDPGFISISLTVTGQRELTGKLATWGANVQHMTPAWEQVGDRLLQDFEQQFDAEGGYLGAKVGPKWAPLKPETVKDRLRKGYGGTKPILVREGLLKGSLTHRGAAGNIFQATDTGITVGSEVPYAIFHQKGTRKMLSRKMVGLKWTTRSAILRILGDYVREQARAAGLTVDMNAATYQFDSGGGEEE